MESIPHFENMQQKQKEWDTVVRSLEHVVDGLGMPIDSNIIETLAGFNVNHFHTISSCGGHTDAERIRLPYIHFAPPEKPHYRYENEASFRKQIAEKYQLNESDIDQDINKEADREYWKAMDVQQETPEWREWYSKLVDLEGQIDKLLEHFYSQNNFAGGVFHTRGIGGAVVMEPIEREKIFDDLVDDQKKIELVKSYQQQIEKIGTYLKELYFST